MNAAAVWLLTANALLAAAAVAVAAGRLLRHLTARKARRVLAARPQPASVPLSPVSAHPAARWRAATAPPLWPDGEPLSPAEKRAWTRIADRFADGERMTRAQEIRDGIGEDR